MSFGAGTLRLCVALRCYPGFLVEVPALPVLPHFGPVRGRRAAVLTLQAQPNHGVNAPHPTGMYARAVELVMLDDVAKSRKRARTRVQPLSSMVHRTVCCSFAGQCSRSWDGYALPAPTLAQQLALVRTHNYVVESSN